MATKKNETEKEPETKPFSGVGDDRVAQVSVGGCTPKELDRAMKDRNNIQAKLSELSGDMSATMKRFEDNGGNKQAFALAQKLFRMEEAKARDLWLCLEAYMEYFGVFKQLNLFEDKVVLMPGDKAAASGPATPKPIGVAQAEAIASAPMTH